jgi:glucose-6-phosphate isomerase
MSYEVRASLGSLQDAVDAQLTKFEQEEVASRIWKKDPTVWKQDEATKAKISDRLGWLQVPQSALGSIADLNEFVQGVKEEGFKHVVLLGMGGSTLGPEVVYQTLGKVEGFPDFIMVDTTDADFIKSVRERIDPATTLFIVSSKSGSTIEPNTFMAYFWNEVKAAKGDDKVGENFVAITDPGTQMEKHARDNHFRDVFLNPADIGGRYSVLSYFGAVPAALCGYDVARLLQRAVDMGQECRKPGADNPGLHLGTIMGVAAKHGRDKTTIVVPPALSSYGLWSEQLIAESTGKEGRGVVPVAGEDLGDPEVYGNDRLFVSISLADGDNSATDAKLKRLEEAGHPVVRLSMSDLYDISAEFFRWEFAIPIAGAVLDINPFDEPNVTESKNNTTRLLEVFNKDKKLPLPDFTSAESGLQATKNGGADDVNGSLTALMDSVKPGDYVAFLAYITPSAEADKLLQEIRTAVRDSKQVATTVGYGPRFLHSTGQLHKGGANNGVFVSIVADNAEKLPIPGKDFDFATLKWAQALGDFESLQTHGRRAVMLYPSGAGLTEVAAAVKKALRDKPAVPGF